MSTSTTTPVFCCHCRYYRDPYSGERDHQGHLIGEHCVPPGYPHQRLGYYDTSPWVGSPKVLNGNNDCTLYCPKFWYTVWTAIRLFFSPLFSTRKDPS